MTAANIAQTGIAAFGAGDAGAAVAQTGLEAFASNESASAVGTAGIEAFASNNAGAAIAGAGMMAWGTLYNIFPYANIANVGLQVFTASEPAASIIEAGIMAWVGYQETVAAPAPAPSIVTANGDIALVWDEQNGFADFQMSGPDLLTDAGLHTAIIISLFTDRLADADDVIPDGSTDRRGWWGDAYSTASSVNGYPDLIGSRLWLLERSTLTQQTLNQAQDYCNEALAWMLEDGVVGSIDVTCTAITINTMQIVIAYTQDGELKKFSTKWKALL